MGDQLQNAELDDLLDLIVSLKSAMHELNRWFFSKRKVVSNAENILNDIWGLVHTFRTERIFTEEKFYWDPINQIAMQSFKMAGSLNSTINSPELVQQFMELRQYVVKLEKSAVRRKYFLDTGRIASHIGTISWAAKLSGKSEITIRRQIKKNKIWALQVTKFWWIPKEEIRGDSVRGN